MSNARVFITGMGIISPLGRGLTATRDAIKTGETGIKPLRLFPFALDDSLPAGEIKEQIPKDDMPRTHAIAQIAAKEALDNSTEAPDAIVIGITTGGIPTTEELLRAGNKKPELYKNHSIASVAEYIARQTGCKGPVISISTACSSSAVAMKIAMELLRCGKTKRVLTGGVDALCRLTVYGFNSLQLIDHSGARPLDRDRKGISVAEGAAMLLLAAQDSPPDDAIAELRGIGLSCDAYHPAAPHPDGIGAENAMRAALADSGISTKKIDYINLHGTGTLDNDLSEAKAIHSLFGNKIPSLSSIKGALGHSLAASGTIEVIVSAISITDKIIPANTRCENPDPELKLKPVMKPVSADVNTVLSNSFGFGGNNASVIVSSLQKGGGSKAVRKGAKLAVLSSSCITGAGDTAKTIKSICAGNDCKGVFDLAQLTGNMPRNVRRLKRLPRMTLWLANNANEKSDTEAAPSSVFFGTGWGALTETNNFLTKLFESDEQFTSPADFIGSVHNAPAGQVAMMLKSTGPNITATGGDYSFEQALLSASLLAQDSDNSLMVIGADEYHEVLSNLFDPSAAQCEYHSDGGGAIHLRHAAESSGLRIYPAFYEYSFDNDDIIKNLIHELGGAERINDIFAAILVGIPAAKRDECGNQLDEFLSLTGFSNPVIDYRKITGEFASASAVATVLALQFIESGNIPKSICGNNDITLNDKGILILGLGDFVTAIEALS